MNIVRVHLKKSPAEYFGALVALQQQFANACNFVAEIASSNDCFSRIRLHHIAYKATRERFPQLGSQLVSNAIYSVCRKARIDQSKASELLKFDEFSPVIFDRHTLSLKLSTLSILALDGRIRFQVKLSSEFLRLFKETPLKEVQLIRDQGEFFLLFFFKNLILEKDPLSIENEKV
jgi:hypothetical protein